MTTKQGADHSFDSCSRAQTNPGSSLLIVFKVLKLDSMFLPEKSLLEYAMQSRDGFQPRQVNDEPGSPAP